ncbi:MAG: carbonic anhydrase [Gammaproteobacteria bacterium]|nr:carbonic anhydrase [Gammaproteobacteria bacterium]
MNSYQKLLLSNRAWAAEQIVDDPDYFARLARIQRPEFLWIGCSDSRVPENQITGTLPGEMFVHRNIANLVVNTDLNLLTVLEYAVVYLEVRHIIVCGHYGCGGVRAAMSRHSFGLIDAWLRNIKDVYRLHEGEFAAIGDDDARCSRLVERSVMEQVLNLSKTTVIQRAWQGHQRPHLHGWVYGLGDGLLRPLCDVKPGGEISEIYRYDDL